MNGSNGPGPLAGRAGDRGAVYDLGYRPYDEPVGDRAAARLALWRVSVRRALGLRRSWRQKVLPWTLLAITTVPAVVNVGVGYLTRDTPAEGFEFITYREYVGVSTALLVFVAITAPDIVCPDRRHRVLPLIFARPLDGRDYVLAKVGAIAAIVFGFGFLPQVVLFVGQALVSDGAWDYVAGNLDVVWQVPIAVAVLALYYAVVGVAVSSFTSRRVVGGVALLGTALVTSTVASVLNVPDGEGAGALVNLLAIPLYVRDLVFLGHIAGESALTGTPGGGALAVVVYAAVVTAGFAALLHRYRWTDS